MNQKNLLLNLLLTAIFFATTFSLSCNKNADQFTNEAHPSVGYLAPDFSLVNIDGDTTSLSDHRGKVVLIEFWASWCGYCLAEIPELKEIHDDFKNHEFELIGVSIDKNKNNWVDKIEEKDMDYIQLIDPEGFSAETIKKYEVDLIPKMFLVNKDGFIIQISNDAGKIRSILDQLFN